MESINDDMTQSEFEALRNQLTYLEMLESFESKQEQRDEIEAIKQQLGQEEDE